MNILEVKTVVKILCKNLKRHVIETTNFKRLKKLPLTEEENKPHKKQKLVISAEINFNIRKNIFACLFSVHNTISLSRHEQVCLIICMFV